MNGLLRAIVDDDWAPGSVFGLISALNPASARPAPRAMEQLLDRPDFLLCTDLGTEIAEDEGSEMTGSARTSPMDRQPYLS